MHATNKFDVLLNLYKIKPMKQSNVFKTFSATRLLANRAEGDVLHFDSNENISEEMSEINNKELKYLEEQLHVTHAPLKKKKQEVIKAPNYGNPRKLDAAFDNGLFTESVTSIEVENIENQQNNKNKIEEKHFKRNVKSATYFVPETTNNSNNKNQFTDSQWEANLENEKEKHYNSRKRTHGNKKSNKLKITLMTPVNTTVLRYMGFDRPIEDPTEKQVLHFYDDPFNRIEEIRKEDDRSVIAI